jgi:hypothetical protein
MNPEQHHHTIIIGAGPAGLFAGAVMKVPGALILEKKEQPGRKLMISGTGQCNYTHAGPAGDFLKHYGENGTFLKKAIGTFSNRDAVRFFSDRGIPAVTDKNGKIFPASLKAGDILKALTGACRNAGTGIITSAAVTAADKYHEGFRITTGGRVYTCRYLLIATGGLSYPATGSTGDGYVYARNFGHTIAEPRPALCPVVISGFTFCGLQGVSIKNAKISLIRNGKKIREHCGDTGFTRNGLTGPGIIDFSRFIEADDMLEIQLGSQDAASFEQEFLKTSAECGKTSILSFLRSSGLTRSLAAHLLEEEKINFEKPLAEISKAQRKALVQKCCAYPFRVLHKEGFKTAMATAGGVSLKEVNSSTMESLLVPGLFFAGEVLDIDGDTGGYNIQAAFSSAWLAAEAIQSLIQNKGHGG